MDLDELLKFDARDMTQEIKMAMSLAYSQTDAYPKALAYFMFREIIEDAHTKYNISDYDMGEMCKMAVNRAALYIALARHEDPIYLRAFAVNAAMCTGWDDAEQTEDIEREMDLIAQCVEILRRAEEGT